MEANGTAPPTADSSPSSWEHRFVEGVIRRCGQDKGLAAKLRRADNPAMEYQSWELLASFGVDLEWENQRLPFVTVASAIAKSKAERDGKLTLGQAIARCYEDGKESNQAKARLRRLLACNDLPEVCRILRSTLSLIDSKVARPLNFTRLLKELRLFPFDDKRVKAQWAQDFYSHSAHADSEEAPS
ncbi:type I-E CRISPR-associated protein Cse2/CasB [Marinobacter sp. MMG032]|uniref:Type I-E CRISPR-associated protein Cse2/CasB n=1 Tax=Marinobacter sp. MMG032 TaxID=3158548 RepID=A0AAU7MQ18_9GAMM